MIISASRRTDIPAFYGEWFRARLEAGFFDRVNPYNPSQIKRISLAPADVDCFVFWTKNPAPFLETLKYLNMLNYKYYFQLTLNDYPDFFEPGLPSVEKRVEALRRLSDIISPEKIVWRYDPIVISDVTPVEYHLERFDRLCKAIADNVGRAVISFMVHYKKVRRALENLEIRKGVKFIDMAEPENQAPLNETAAGLAGIAARRGVSLYSCCAHPEIKKHGIYPAACIDGEHIKKLFNAEKNFKKDKSQRKDCLCVESADMGVYDTCPHGCVYCYATMNQARAAENFKKHSSSSPSLMRY